MGDVRVKLQLENFKNLNIEIGTQGTHIDDDANSNP